MSLPIISLSEHDKRVLGTIGRAAYGKELVDIITKMRNQVSSLEGMSSGGDHNAQVEGRLLFKDMADELIKPLSAMRRQMKPVQRDEFE